MAQTIKSLKQILLSIIMVFVGVFGLTACSNFDDNLYIEVKHPITGEWVRSSDNGWKSVTWDLPYTGEGYPLEVRYKYHGNIVDPEEEHLAARGNMWTETPNTIGQYEFKYFVERPATKINTTNLSIWMNIYGEFDIENNLKVELCKQKIHTTAVGFFNNTYKHYKFTVPENGTYRFETVDGNTERLKYLLLWGIKSGTQNEEDNNIYLEADLEANTEYTISTGVQERYLNRLSDNSYYEICIKRIA